MSDADKKKVDLRERVRRALDVPPDVLARECMIEIRGRGLITVHGCERIARYLPDQIRIITASGGVLIRGDALLCVSFSSGSVGIEGRVDSVEFFEEEL